MYTSLRDYHSSLFVSYQGIISEHSTVSIVLITLIRIGAYQPLGMCIHGSLLLINK